MEVEPHPPPPTVSPPLGGSTLHDAIRRALQTKAGVTPSDHWLMDCIAAVQHQTSSHNENVLADLCLQQVLHHDLRDVVRTFEDQPQQQQHDTSNTLSSVSLRQAIVQSKQETSQRKAIWTASHGLLIQVEEFLDVSQSATARLEGTGRAGQSTGRCLKLAISDGYHPQTGLPYCPPHDDWHATETCTANSTVLVAMEVGALPDLSLQSPAGLKVLLTGAPITVRHGVLLLHPGNAMVLGGHVPELVQWQQQALEQAKRLAGVGVDPTIRALIGNQPQEEDEENEEERDTGEGASGDLSPAPPPSLAPPTVTPNNNNNNNSTNHLTFPSSASTAGRNTHRAPPPSLSTSNPYASSTSHSFANTGSTTTTTNTTSTTTRRTQPMEVEVIELDDDSIDELLAATPPPVHTAVPSVVSSLTGAPPHPSNPYAAAHPPPSTQTTPPPPNNNNNNPVTVRQQARRNPYASNAPAPTLPLAGVSPTTRRSNHSHNSQADASSAIQAPSQTNNNNPYHPNTSTVHRTSVTTSNNPSTSFQARETPNIARSMATTPSSTLSPVPSVSAHLPTNTAGPPSSSCLQAAQSRPLRLSFDELRLLMIQICGNPTLYQQNVGRVFVTSLCQIGPRVYFNIDRSQSPSPEAPSQEEPASNRTKKKKKKEKHYVYKLICRYGGQPQRVDNNTPAKDGDLTVPPSLSLMTCQVSSALQEPHFGRPPKEMRKYHKVNREEADREVKLGGARIAAEFARPKPYELTLVQYQDTGDEDEDDAPDKDNPNNENSQNNNPNNPSPGTKKSFPTQVDGKHPILVILRKHETTY